MMDSTIRIIIKALAWFTAGNIMSIALLGSPEDAIIKEKLKMGLCRALADNNQLVAQRTPLDAEQSVRTLTDGFIQQLDFIKILSWERILQERLKHQLELQCVQQSQLSLYEQLLNGAFYRPLQAIQPDNVNYDWNKALRLVIGLFSGRDKLKENPNYLEDFSGFLPPTVLKQWQMEGFKGASSYTVEEIFYIPQACGYMGTYWVFSKNDQQKRRVSRLCMHWNRSACFVESIEECDMLSMVQRARACVERHGRKVV